MTFTITRRKLFLAIKGLHPNVRVTDPEFSEYAKEALFVHFDLVDEENISTKDSDIISKFLKDFVLRTHTYWRQRKAHRNSEKMFYNHKGYFDKIIDFGNLKPPEAAVVEIKREVLKLIDKLDVGIKNEIQNLKKEIKKGMENEFEVEGSLDLSFNLVEKLDARIEKEIQNFRIEVKKEVLQMSDKIKNEIQKLKLQNENEKGFEEEIVEENLDPCELPPLKNEIQDGIKPKIEFKFERINEEMQVQRGIEIMDKLDVPTIKNEGQDDFKAKIRVEKDIKTKLEMKRENEIHDGLKPKIELEFKRIKEEMEVQRGMDIIEKLNPPTKKPKLSLEMTDHLNNPEHISPKNPKTPNLILRHCGVGDCDFSSRYKSNLMRHKQRLESVQDFFVQVGHETTST